MPTSKYSRARRREYLNSAQPGAAAQPDSSSSTPAQPERHGVKGAPGFVLSGASKYVCGIITTIIGSVIAALALGYLHLQPGGQWTHGKLEDCPNLPVYFMARAFELEKSGSSPSTVKANVRIEDSYQQTTSWDGHYLLDGERLHVPLQAFANIGYDVKYDRRRSIIVMRRKGDYACIAFCCLQGGSTRVMAIWADKNSYPWFDDWWNEKPGAILGQRQMYYTNANSPAVIYGDDQTVDIPIRVLAGAMNANPDEDGKHVSFHRSVDYRTHGTYDTVTILIPGRISDIAPVSMAQVNDQWIAPEEIASDVAGATSR